MLSELIKKIETMQNDCVIDVVGSSLSFKILTQGDWLDIHETVSKKMKDKDAEEGVRAKYFDIETLRKAYIKKDTSDDIDFYKLEPTIVNYILERYKEHINHFQEGIEKKLQK